MADICVKGLKEFFKEHEIPEKEIKQVVDHLVAYKRASEKGNVPYNVLAQKYFKEFTEIQSAKKALFIMDVEKNLELRTHTTQAAYEKDPHTAALSILVETNKVANGAGDTVENRAHGYAEDFRNLMYFGLENVKKGQKPLTSLYVSGQADLEIRKGMFALQTGQAMEGISEPAKQIAQAAVNTHKRILQVTQDLGIPLRERKVFLGTMSHNAELLMGSTGNVADGFKAWSTRLRQLNFDREVLFGPAMGDAAQEEKILRSFFDDVIQTKVGSDHLMSESFADELLSPSRTASTQDKLIRSKALVFLDPESEHAYASEFSGKTFAEQMEQSIKKKARMIGAISKLGSDPKQGYLTALDNLAAHHTKNGEHALAKKVVPHPERNGDARYDETLLWRLQEVLGENSVPVSQTKATVGAVIRSSTALSQLSLASISMLPNLPITAVTIRDRTGRNLFQSSLDVAMGFMRTIPSERRNKFMADFAQYQSDIQQHLNHQLMGGGAKAIPSKMMGVMYNLNGANWLNNSVRYAALLRFGEDAHLALSSGKIPDEMLATFMHHGIDKADLDVMKTAFDDLADGRKILSLDALKSIPKESFRARAEELQIPMGRYKTTLEVKYAGLLHSLSQQATTTAGANEKGLLSMGTSPGTNIGELNRLMMQYKAFAFNGMNVFLRTLGTSPDKQALARGQLISKGKNWMSTGQMLIGGMTMAYVGMQLRNQMRGKPMDDPNDPATWVKAGVRSGAFGIAGDIVGQTYTGKFTNLTKETMGAVLGPTLSQPWNVLNAASQDDTKFDGKRGGLSTATRKELIKTVRNNIWFQNAPLVKEALDHMQYDVLYKSVMPEGSYTRMQNDFKRSQGEVVEPKKRTRKKKEE